MEELTKENKDRIKQLKNHINREYKLMKKAKVPIISVGHLERIIKLYNDLYSIQKPTLSDKTGFSMLKIQYKTLCAVSGTKPNKEILK